MKRISFIIISVLILLFISSCTNEETSQDGISVYYINDEGDGLDSFTVELATEYSDELIETLIAAIEDPTVADEDGERSVLQNAIMISSYSYDSDAACLNIDLSGDYGSLSNGDKLLLTAGLTLTFDQVDEISSVYITIQGEPLLDSNDEEIGSLNTEDFVVHYGTEINIYTSANMELYFLDETGEALTMEERTVYYNSNVPLEQVVLEELIKGPQIQSNQAALPSNLRFLSVTIQDNICYINFDENVVQMMATYDSSLALESIVQSINAVCGVRQVQFFVNGDMYVEFKDGTTIDHIFEA